MNTSILIEYKPKQEYLINRFNILLNKRDENINKQCLEVIRYTNEDNLTNQNNLNNN